jgi:hypothetical protein
MTHPGNAPSPPSGVVYTGPSLTRSLGKFVRVLLSA